MKPTEEENRKFDERVKWLENVMAPRRELYETEEKTLRVMLAEEEEEKEKERRENERKNQGTGPSNFSYACRLFSRGVIFTRARVSLALLSLRKNGGLLVV